MTLIGSPAPDFSLTGADAKVHPLADFRGKWLVLAFYRGDDTPTCSRQLSEYNSFYPDLVEADVNLVGISPDSPDSHYVFGCRLDLQFPLLADTDKRVAKQYGVTHIITGYGRVTFIIDPEGNVRDILKPAVGGLFTYPSVAEVRESLTALNALA